MNENEILGFNPQDLSVFNKEDRPAKSSGSNLMYKPKPAETKSEDGNYYSKIKVIYNPFAVRTSILEQQSYAMQDKDGFFSVVSSLTNDDTNCPIFKAWKKCHYAEPGTALYNQALTKDKGGKGLFDKRFARFVIIQVIEDENQPELEGKYLIWKLPKSIFDLIDDMQNPSNKKTAPFPAMDLLFGKTIKLKVKPGEGKPGEERYSRETKYFGSFAEGNSSVVNPDGSPVLNDEEKKVLRTYIADMADVWEESDPEKRKEAEDRINAEENTKELKKIYSRVLNEVKAICPNLEEVVGYKPWTADETARVNAWIETVLACKDPLDGVEPANTSSPFVEDSGTVTTAKPEPVSTASSDDDELPF